MRDESHKWALGLVVTAVLALGWKYPLIGYVVPVVVVSVLLCPKKAVRIPR